LLLFVGFPSALGEGLDALDFLKGLVPLPLRNRLRARYDDHVFRRAMREFRSDPEKWLFPDSPIIRELIRGWSNEGWSAKEEFLVVCGQHALATNGPILECGSGLTTILLGVIADRLGQTVWSLEHIPEWGQRVQKTLKKLNIQSVNVDIRPLRDFGGFSWYDVPTVLPQFSLVVCDGPPAHTHGGRYGLVPIMRSKLKPGAVILLDDAVRKQEQLIASRWAVELKTDYRILGTAMSYVRLTVPEFATTNTPSAVGLTRRRRGTRL